MSAPGSVLVPERQGLALPVLLALFGHVFLLGMAVVMADCRSQRDPIIDPTEAMVIDFTVLPRSKSSMPEKASRAPRPSGKDTQAPPRDVPDEVSDLKVRQPDAPEAQGAPDRSADRSTIMRSLLMKQLAEEVDESAPLGTVDRQASDPDSDSEVGIGSGTPGLNRADPEYARYAAELQALFKGNFRPLPTIAMSNPDIEVLVRVRFDLDTGEVIDFSIEQSSGNASYDSAATRAVQGITEVPLPPKKFRSEFRSGFLLRFSED